MFEPGDRVRVRTSGEMGIVVGKGDVLFTYEVMFNYSDIRDYFEVDLESLKEENMFNIGDKVDVSFDGKTYVSGEVVWIYSCPDDVCDVEINGIKVPVSTRFLTLSDNKVRFPNDFYEWDGTDISDEQINGWIEDIIEGKASGISSGNTYVWKDNDKIYVAKKYWEYDLNE